MGPQSLKPATSLGWHEQGPFRGPVGKMMETMEKCRNQKPKKLTLQQLGPFSCEEEPNCRSVDFRICTLLDRVYKRNTIISSEKPYTNQENTSKNIYWLARPYLL